MKKHLLASTALIAAGVLASTANAQPMSKAKKPFITVGGYMEMTFGGILSQKHDQGVIPGRKNAGADVHNESEVHFKGQATLDNGIRILTRIELEGDGDGNPGERFVNYGHAPQGSGGIASDTIDEAYMIIRGSFGEINLGSIDSAGYRMTIGYSGSWATGVGQNLTFDVTEWIDTVTSGYAGFNVIRDVRLRDSDDDSEKISYFTPRFEGFQLGVSYVPNATQDINNSYADASHALHDGFSVGANFDRKLGQIGVGVAAGYHQFQKPELAGVFPGTDQKVAVIAVSGTYGPFKLSGAYKRTMEMGSGGGPGGDSRGHVYDIGARYVMGPNQFSFGWLSGKTDNAANKQEYQAAIISYARILGPGVKWYASGLYNDSKNNNNSGLGGVAGAEVGAPTNDGYAMSTGVRVNF